MIRNLSYEIREARIPSRFFFAPINTGFALNGSPTIELIHFHKERSSPDIGVCYVGNVAIDSAYTTNSNTLYFKENDRGLWRHLTHVISSKGSMPGVQIACRHSELPPQKNWKAGGNPEEVLAILKKQILELDKDFIESIVNYFNKSLDYALDVGFKCVQIHGAHGYFLSLLSSPMLNERRDEFGFRENKALKNVIQHAISRRNYFNYVLDVRISLTEGIDDRDQETKSKSDLITFLCDSGIDILSVSHGIYDFSKYLIYPGPSHSIEKSILEINNFADLYPKVLWNYAGNVNNLQDLPEDLNDMITFSIGRSLIADPKFVDKSLRRSMSEVIPCNHKGKCHYFSRGEYKLYCPFDSYLVQLKNSEDSHEELKVNDYQRMALRTAVYPEDEKALTYLILGLVGEAGEVAEKYKRIIREKGGEIDSSLKKEILLEIGDVIWYASAICSELGVNLAEVCNINLTKLEARLKKGTLFGEGDSR